MNYRLIVTHDGLFHADEVLAIETILFLVGYDIPVVRTRDKAKLAEYLVDPTVLVLDVGGDYNPAMGNFDHHQDKELMATNMLVLLHFGAGLRAGLVEEMATALYLRVSRIDTGQVQSDPDDIYHSTEFNALIRSLNSLPTGGFEAARTMASAAVRGCFETAHLKLTGAERWASLHKEQHIAYLGNTAFIPEWRDYAEGDEILFLVAPNVDGSCRLFTANLDLAIPSGAAGQVKVLHSGSFAIYVDKAAAIKHARLLVRQLMI